MNTELNELLKKLRENLPVLQEQHAIQSLEVFGSYTQGAQTDLSDLDILVTYSVAPSLLQFIALENQLSDLLGVKVDLVMKRALIPDLKEYILAEAIPV